MSAPISSVSASHASGVFTKQTMNRGQPTTIRCIEIGGQVYAISKGPLTVVSLEDDWFEDVTNPDTVIATLREGVDVKPDLFTFWQRLPDVEPKHAFYVEWDQLAVLPIRSYEHWWNHQIKSRVRNQIRKSEKAGLVVREVAYDNHFVQGMTTIFNETPVRQDRPFWHWGKDFDTVKTQFSRNVHREDLIGAYYKGEMIGFIMMGNAGRYGVTTQIISSIRHRDKAISSAMIAKAVELCERRRLDHLVYLFWNDGSLAEFKRRCGFEMIRVPRYFVPLTQRGVLALRFGFHRGWKEVLPAKLKNSLKALRGRWQSAGSPFYS